MSEQAVYREIPLTRGKVALVDAADYDFLMQWKWYAAYDKRYDSWYAIAGVGVDAKSTQLKMHRVILGETNPRVMVDHRDRNGLNNQRSNLRRSTNAQNQGNRTKAANLASRYKGVSKKGSRWRAKLCANGQSLYLGLFNDEIEAAKAYDDAARKHFGEFARLNFPQEGEHGIN